MKIALDQQVIMVTGATGNLGTALVETLDETGANLILVAREAQKLRDTFPDLVNSPTVYLSSATDLTDPGQVNATVIEAIQKLGKIDGLVNAAGAYRGGKTIENTDPETLEMLLSINLRTAFLTSRAVIPGMRAQGSGSIVNIAARPGLRGVAGLGAYSAAKGGLIRLTESMAAELKHARIRANCILPGTIDTPENRKAMPDADYERWVKPDQIAQVIAFLLSDLAAPISGASIPVYGQS